MDKENEFYDENKQEQRLSTREMQDEYMKKIKLTDEEEAIAINSDVDEAVSANNSQ